MRGSASKQYNLVLVKQQRCLTAGKVTVGLASHWPCVRDQRYIKLTYVSFWAHLYGMWLPVAVRRVANCYTPFTFITLLYVIYHLVSHLIVWFIHLGGAYGFTAYRRKTGSWAPRLHYSRYIYLHDQVLQVREQQTQILIISIPRNLGYIFGGTRISLQHSLG